MEERVIQEVQGALVRQGVVAAATTLAGALKGAGGGSLSRDDLEEICRQSAADLCREAGVSDAGRRKNVWDALADLVAWQPAVAAVAFGKFQELAANGDPAAASERQAWAKVWESNRGDELLPPFLKPETSPEAKSPENRLMFAIQRLAEMPGRVHSTFFPTVRLVEDCEIGGDVFRVTIHILMWAASGQPEVQEVTNAPLVFMAPWSVLRIERAKLEHSVIEELVRKPSLATLRGSFGLEATMRFLIELEHVPRSNPKPLPFLEVSGESLTLATCLAAWAASQKRELRPMVVTGAVEVTAQGVFIQPLGGVANKTQAFLASQAGTRAEFLLVPSENVSEARGAGLACVKEAPLQLADLLVPPDFLVDGFDYFRERVRSFAPPTGTEEIDRVGQYLARDWKALATLADALRLEPIDAASSFCATERLPGVVYEERAGDARIDHREVVVPLPFGNEPAEAVDFIVHELFCSLEQRKNDTCPLTSLPVPVPVNLRDVLGPLREGSEGRENLDSDFIARNRQSLIRQLSRQLSKEIDLLLVRVEKRTAPSSSQGNGTSAVAPTVFENLLTERHLAKLCLVVYSERSGKWDEEDRFTVEVLRRLFRTEAAIEAVPGIVFLASDLHHARMINSVWKQVAEGTESKAPGTA